MINLQSVALVIKRMRIFNRDTELYACILTFKSRNLSNRFRLYLSTCFHILNVFFFFFFDKADNIIKNAWKYRGRFIVMRRNNVVPLCKTKIFTCDLYTYRLLTASNAIKRSSFLINTAEGSNNIKNIRRGHFFFFYPPAVK